MQECTLRVLYFLSSNLERHFKDMLSRWTTSSVMGASPSSLSWLERVELQPGKVITGPLKETNSHTYTSSECGWVYSLVFSICRESLFYWTVGEPQCLQRSHTGTARTRKLLTSRKIRSKELKYLPLDTEQNCRPLKFFI